MLLDIDKNDLKKQIKNLVIKKYPLIEEIILFGSYSRGNSDGKSDIDLFISKPERVPAKYVYCMIGDLKELYDKDIDLFRSSDVNKNSDIYDVIINEGEIIYERQKQR